MLEYCNICKTETETVIVKQKKGSGGVYCMKCRSYKRNITPTDKKLLTEATYLLNISKDVDKVLFNRAITNH